MRYSEFVRLSRQQAPYLRHQGDDYLSYHAARFHKTFEVCSRLVGRGGRILSVGAGSAYVETLLARDLEAQVIVADFAEAMAMNAPHYQSEGFTTLAVDLCSPDNRFDLQPVDLAICAEIIEHLPQPPRLMFGDLFRTVKGGGHVVVTTPNLGSLRSIAKLCLMHPLLPPAEQTFGPVSFENEAVHRREYMPSEMEQSLKAVGFGNLERHYLWYHKPSNLWEWMSYGPELVVARFRPAILVVGAKN